jgi:hypothetical protein
MIICFSARYFVLQVRIRYNKENVSWKLLSAEGWRVIELCRRPIHSHHSSHPDEGGSKFPWKVGTLPPDNSLCYDHSHNISSHKIFLLSRIIFRSVLLGLQIVSAYFCQNPSPPNDRADRDLYLQEVDMNDIKERKHRNKPLGYVCYNTPSHVQVKNVAKFIVKTMFYTDQAKVTSHISICRYLVMCLHISLLYTYIVTPLWFCDGEYVPQWGRKIYV